MADTNPVLQPSWKLLLILQLWGEWSLKGDVKDLFLFLQGLCTSKVMSWGFLQVFEKAEGGAGWGQQQCLNGASVNTWCRTVLKPGAATRRDRQGRESRNPMAGWISQSAGRLCTDLEEQVRNRYGLWPVLYDQNKYGYYRHESRGLWFHCVCWEVFLNLQELTVFTFKSSPMRFFSGSLSVLKLLYSLQSSTGQMVIVYLEFYCCLALNRCAQDCLTQSRPSYFFVLPFVLQPLAVNSVC